MSLPQGIQHVAKALSEAECQELRSSMEALFREAPSRVPFQFRGRQAWNRRDALWFSAPCPEEPGFLYLYRTHAQAKYDPRGHARHIAPLPVPSPMPEWLQALATSLWSRLGLRGTPTHAVLHRYVDGSDQITYHHDKWMDMEPGSHILSLSLGACRKFLVGTQEGRVVCSALLAEGDVITLGHEANKLYKHAIPQERNAWGVRYSITLRCMDSRYHPELRVYRTRHPEFEGTF